MISRESMGLGPVVVGALGGSGTRLVAALLAELGYFLGSDLNAERDNLTFTLLFKRRRWLERDVPRDPAQVHTGLRILEKTMLTAQPLDEGERRFLRRAVREVALHGYDHRHRGAGAWPLVRAHRLLRAQPLDPRRFRGWGWKEPNSHLFLPELVEHFPGLRFVYVLRHGLDMACSSNDTQLRLWGPRYGVELGRGRQAHARAMLEFWIRVSERVIEQGHRELGQRFLVLPFDRLIESPEQGLASLLAFLSIDPAEVDLRRLLALPVRPASIGRYKRRGLEPFTPRLLEGVRALGFAIEADGAPAGAQLSSVRRTAKSHT